MSYAPETMVQEPSSDGIETPTDTTVDEMMNITKELADIASDGIDIKADTDVDSKESEIGKLRQELDQANDVVAGLRQELDQVKRRAEAAETDVEMYKKQLLVFESIRKACLDMEPISLPHSNKRSISQDSGIGSFSSDSVDKDTDDDGPPRVAKRRRTNVYRLKTPEDPRSSLVPTASPAETLVSEEASGSSSTSHSAEDEDGPMVVKRRRVQVLTTAAASDGHYYRCVLCSHSNKTGLRYHWTFKGGAHPDYPYQWNTHIRAHREKFWYTALDLSDVTCPEEYRPSKADLFIDGKPVTGAVRRWLGYSDMEWTEAWKKAGKRSTKNTED